MANGIDRNSKLDTVAGSVRRIFLCKGGGGGLYWNDLDQGNKVH